MEMVIRGDRISAPYQLGADAQPTGPFLRDDRDDVGQALPAGNAALLDEEQPQEAGLAHGVLDHGPTAASERGYGVDGKDADAGALTLASNDRQDRQLGHRERCGDLGRDDPAHGLSTAPLDARLSVRRPRAPGGPRKAQDCP